jgi:hypothetical protein
MFEAYDVPGLKTIDGIAQLGPDKVAWFRDPGRQHPVADAAERVGIAQGRAQGEIRGCGRGNPC